MLISKPVKLDLLNTYLILLRSLASLGLAPINIPVTYFVTLMMLRAATKRLLW